MADEVGYEYKKHSIQPFDVIDECFTLEEQKGFYRGNVLKYIMRMNDKGQTADDAKKALAYCQKLNELYENNGDKVDNSKFINAVKSMVQKMRKNLILSKEEETELFKLVDNL